MARYPLQALDVALTPAALFVIAARPGRAPLLVRLDRATGTMLRTEVAGGPVRVLADADDVAVLTETGKLRLYDAQTLRARAATTVSQLTGAAALTPAGVWVGTADRLVLIDATTGRPRRTLRAAGPVVSVAYDTQHRRLFTLTAGPTSSGGGPSTLERRSPTTGTTRATASAGGLLNGESDGHGGLRPTSDNADELQVWNGQLLVLNITGLQAFYGAYTAQTLTTNHLLVGGSNGIRATVADGTVWTLDNNTAHCLDAQLRTRGQTDDPDAGTVIGDQHGTYLYNPTPSGDARSVAAQQMLRRILPGKACQR